MAIDRYRLAPLPDPGCRAKRRPANRTPKDRIAHQPRGIFKDAKFVRNGVAYDAKTAGQFLRGKWKAQESEIKTARDFISKTASTSSTTGQPYLIRLSDGRETKSGEYLTAELEKLESKK